MSKKKAKRTLVMRLKDGQQIHLDLGRVTRLNADFSLFHLDKLKDGKWRLTYSSDVIEDMSKLNFIEMIREN